MKPELQVGQTARNTILPLRAAALSSHGYRVTRLPRDLAPTTRHWAATLDGLVVGCASVMQVRGYALRGMAVAAEHRRLGVGARLLQVVCAAVAAPMWCNARLEVVPFYGSAGWVAVGPVFELQDLGAHQRMVWAP